MTSRSLTYKINVHSTCNVYVTTQMWNLVNDWVIDTFLGFQFWALMTLFSGDYWLVENNTLFLDNEKQVKGEGENKRD